MPSLKVTDADRKEIIARIKNRFPLIKWEKVLAKYGLNEDGTLRKQSK